MPKVVGIRRLQTARDLLRNDGDGSVEPLLEAAIEVWGAMFDLPSWPNELKIAAEELQTSLFRYGPIKETIDNSPLAERLELHDKLLKFIAFANRVHAADDGSESH